jgi:hypothetical protein
MLYRRERRLSPWLVALATAVFVLPLGFWLGRSSAPEPTLTEVLQPSLDLVREVDGALDIVLLEYKRARSGSQASLEAAKSAVHRSEERLKSAKLLRVLYSGPYKQALRTLQKLSNATMVARTPVGQVEYLVKQLRVELTALQPQLSAL